jgi:hypothetical protein
MNCPQCRYKNKYGDENNKCICLYSPNGCDYKLEHNCCCLDTFKFDGCRATKHDCSCDEDVDKCKATKHDCSCDEDVDECRATKHDCSCDKDVDECESTKHDCSCDKDVDECKAELEHRCPCSYNKIKGCKDDYCIF